MNDALLFQGQVTGVKQEVNKGGYGNTGSLTLSLTIKQPAAPVRPRPGYFAWDDRAGDWKPRPAQPKRKPKETDTAWGKRLEEFRAEQKQYDRDLALYQEASEKFAVEWAKFEKAMRDYAWVAGFAGVLGAQEVQVSIAPLNREFLTFERPALIPLPAAIQAEPAEDSEGSAADEEAPEPGARESPASAPITVTSLEVPDGVDIDAEQAEPYIGEGGVLCCPNCDDPCSEHDEPGTPSGGCSATRDESTGELCLCEWMWKVEVPVG